MSPVRGKALQRRIRLRHKRRECDVQIPQFQVQFVAHIRKYLFRHLHFPFFLCLYMSHAISPLPVSFSEYPASARTFPCKNNLKNRQTNSTRPAFSPRNTAASDEAAPPLPPPSPLSPHAWRTPPRPPASETSGCSNLPPVPDPGHP